MLLGKQKEKVAQFLSQLDKIDYDVEIGIDLRNQIEGVIGNTEKELESV